MDPDPNRFLADVMLGRLARWLRIVGYDTLYFRDMNDQELLRRAIQDNRTLLTRDRELSQRGGSRALLITGEDLESQLIQVLEEMNLRPRVGNGIRCPLCNETLKETPREDVQNAVPPYVWDTQRKFSRCPGCGRIFWEGTHWDRIRRRLHRVGCRRPSEDP